MKNIFALANFRFSYGIAAILGICIGTILPVWGTIFSTGLTQGFFAMTVFIRLISATLGCIHTGTTLWSVPFSFVTPYVNIYIMFKGMMTNLADDGINWRGTHYPLDKLRKNEPIL